MTIEPSSPDADRLVPIESGSRPAKTPTENLPGKSDSSRRPKPVVQPIIRDAYSVRPILVYASAYRNDCASFNQDRASGRAAEWGPSRTQGGDHVHYNHQTRFGTPAPDHDRSWLHRDGNSTRSRDDAPRTRRECVDHL